LKIGLSEGKKSGVEGVGSHTTIYPVLTQWYSLAVEPSIRAYFSWNGLRKYSVDSDQLAFLL
jgi:hypothetical protein